MLTIIAQLVEAQGNGMLCTIFLLDKDGQYVYCAAAPSLQGFIPHIGRIPVGPKHASCGTAVHRREPVYVTDILSNPLWDDYRHLILPYGLRAVWARPLLSSKGKTLGTFASYYNEPRSPSLNDLQLIENASHIAGIAIERQMHEDALRCSQAFLSEAQHLSRVGSFSWQIATDQIAWSEQLYRIFDFGQGTPVTLDLIGSKLHPEDMPVMHDMITRARSHTGDFRIRIPFIDA